MIQSGDDDWIINFPLREQTLGRISYPGFDSLEGFLFGGLSPAFAEAASRRQADQIKIHFSAPSAPQR